MAEDTHIPGGEGEQPIGAAKAEARALWESVSTQAAWEVLTTAQRWEMVRRFIKYALMRWFKMEE